MSQHRGTFGATQNEGSRHGGGDSWGQGPETYGATQNEPGRRSGHGQQGGGDYVPSTGGLGQPTWNGQQPNGHAGTYGTADNEPPRHQDNDNDGSQSNTYGTWGNEPPRHQDTLTEISVKNLNKGKLTPIYVNIDTMSKDELVQKISEEFGMHSGQMSVTYGGKSLSGPGSLRGAGLYSKCTVFAKTCLRGGGSDETMASDTWQATVQRS